MKHNLLTNTPTEWAQKTDIVSYAKRQAQSCIYLDTLFSEIENKTTKHREELSYLFEYLRSVHRRQYANLEELIEIPNVDDRRSFYFDNLYSALDLSTSKLPEPIAEDKLLTILAIQAVSYLRGQDRYRILKDYANKDNDAFKDVWARFYNDATRNAAKVLEFIYDHYEQSKVEAKVKKVIELEDNLIKLIWRHKNVTSY
ncbi:MAG: hypothetical protein ACTSU7_00550 [Candidatus Heimdallarchaeaceae archaeon]